MSYDHMLINDVLSAREDAELRGEAFDEEMSWPPETDWESQFAQATPEDGFILSYEEMSEFLALRKDAARYRWIVESGQWISINSGFDSRGKLLSAAIDRAIEEAR